MRHLPLRTYDLGSIQGVIAVNKTFPRLGRHLVATVATAIATALLAVPASAAGPRLALEPSSPGFQQGSQTSFHIPTRASKATDGGTSPGDTPATPPTVGADLLVGSAVTNLMLLIQFAAKVPIQTEKLLTLIPPATAASATVATLRANIIRMATAYMAAPTLEDKGKSNYSKLLCSFSPQGCKERWAWCAIFASTMWRMAGVRAMPMTPPVGGIVAWGKTHARWHDVGTAKDKNFLPLAGDIVAYGCNRKRDFCDHTGIVVRADAKNIRTIEGNTSTPLAGRDGVASKLRTRATWISGYISLG